MSGTDSDGTASNDDGCLFRLTPREGEVPCRIDALGTARLKYQRDASKESTNGGRVKAVANLANFLVRKALCHMLGGI